MALVKCTYEHTDPIESNINVLDLTNGRINRNADKEYYWDGPVILDKLLNVLGQNLSAFRNEMEKAARKLRKVTVHYNDPRDSHMVTSAAVQAANPYFALGKIIPLDMSIELEQGLCDTLSEALIQVHVPDEKNPGLMKSKMIKKYSVIYED